MIREQKKLKDLNLLDRFLFAEAIEDAEIIELLLSIILGNDVLLKHLPQAEKEQRRLLWGKQVRLDVWAEDTDDIIYDVEVQKRNTHDLSKRSRMYNSMIDSKLLIPGTKSYNELNDVYIIIITPFDLFGEGRYEYIFNMRCKHNPDMELKDGATRIFLNTRGTDSSGVSKELIELLRYIENSTDAVADSSSCEKIHKLHEKISQIKSNEEVGIRLMNLWEEKLLDRQDGYDEGLIDGKKSGISEGKIIEKENIARNMLAKKLDVALISEITGLSEEKILKL